MKLIRFLAIFFFDMLDKFIHQKKIILFFKKKKIKINFFVDVGAHKGSYTDLILKNFKTKKIFMFEPQKKIFKIIIKKYKKITNVKAFNYAISNKNNFQKIYINRHDLTSSLTKLNESNSYLKKKSKLFIENSKQSLIKETYNVKTVRLSDFLNKSSIKKGYSFSHYSDLFIDILSCIEMCRLKNVLSACHVIFIFIAYSVIFIFACWYCTLNHLIYCNYSKLLCV